jgi:hypothetical protein
MSWPSIAPPDSGRDIVWVDGKRLVDEIRNRMIDQLRAGVTRQLD